MLKRHRHKPWRDNVPKLGFTPPVVPAQGRTSPADEPDTSGSRNPYHGDTAAPQESELNDVDQQR